MLSLRQHKIIITFVVIFVMLKGVQTEAVDVVYCVIISNHKCLHVTMKMSVSFFLGIKNNLVTKIKP